MSSRAIGDVRPSQVVTTFGPGAIVDLQTLSVIVAGIDNWIVDDDDALHEPRLQRALRVERFFSAKPTERSGFTKQGTIPTYLFPRYQVCPVCQTLSKPGEGLLKYEEKWSELLCAAPGCKGRGKGRASTLPAPFIVACPSGHLDDFPWRWYVHQGSEVCTKRLSLYSAAQTGTVADIRIKCECGATRSASEAFGEGRAAALRPCTRLRPWLGVGEQDPTPCPHSAETRAMQRGATNGWFPVVRSALAVREAATPIGIAIAACNAKQIEKIDSVETLRTLVALGMFPSLSEFPLDDVWTTILQLRGDAELQDIDLRWPEWLAFGDPAGASRESYELFLESAAVPWGLNGLLHRVVLARKLLEVRALVGFTRIDAPPAGDVGLPAGLAPIFRTRQNWLPAVEVRGEGIFVELLESAVAEWEARPAVVARANAMAEMFAQWQAEREGVPPVAFPGARYVLLHSLAHALIRQLSLDCGYSASSVRERIYSSVDPARRMAGVLLYTASADSEGSLGGLVDLGSPSRFPDLLRNALLSAARCSSDPLCADHQPDVHATINAAACHACILASETSCEVFNRFLDRNTLVATMATDQIAFFKGWAE
ncbi:MAG: DUF1998 domain-containing protein [Phycisphaerales bacterium]|nr:DUF1998 domain-containing protein [Phycisphaerales bacterium]